jgi:hypothetical protein
MDQLADVSFLSCRCDGAEIEQQAGLEVSLNQSVTDSSGDEGRSRRRAAD